MENGKKLIIVGDTAFAEVAFEYFTHDSPYTVVAFSVERDYLKKTELLGLPVVPFETLEQRFAPSEHAFFVASVYTQLNRLRTRLYRAVKVKGFAPASYISSRAFVWRNCQIGEHCFIFEHNVVQPFVRIGDNVVIWSGNHIGHHSVINSHSFISSHVVISGFVEVGESCFLGVNATITNNVTIGPDCLIGAGGVVVKNIDADRIVKGTPSEISEDRSAKRFFKVKE
ncbi:MAG: acetyltransferase [Nitrospirae bacterium]|nr:acetyltransferase [Nitrospirota bacterium]